MADRAITSDLIVAVDGSDEINVTVVPIRGLIKADKTFTVAAGDGILNTVQKAYYDAKVARFITSTGVELRHHKKKGAYDYYEGLVDDTLHLLILNASTGAYSLISASRILAEPSGGNVTGTQLQLLNHCPELLLGKHSAERRMTYVGEVADQVYEGDIRNSAIYTFANLNGTNHMFICYRFYSHTDGSIHQYYLSPEIWQG